MANRQGSSWKWVWYLIKYDYLQPTAENFLQAKWHHYQFCRKSDITITPELYVVDFTVEIENKLLKQKFTNKTSLILRSLLAALAQPETKKEILSFFERDEITEEIVRALQEKINTIRNGAVSSLIPEKRIVEIERGLLVTNAGQATATPTEPIAVIDQTNGQASKELHTPFKPAGTVFYVKTYVIATHLHFELEGDETEYEALSRDLPKLEAFIKEKFQVDKLAGTLSKLKGYSYKDILKGKDTGEKGQLKPPFRQIIDNPQIFGKEISAFAEKIFARDIDS